MLWPRWLFLRALGLIFGSAFYSLAYQVHGLIGRDGITPAASYLDALARAAPGLSRFWAAPTLLWINADDRALTFLVSAGLVASALLTLNVWPRAAAAACTLLFLSCVAALQEFSAYQSDGMLLQAGLASVLLAPRGRRPGIAANAPPTWGSLWLLRWEWFTIYFQSGVVKVLSGDEQWRTLTAMDHYYENGPLPTWIGWYVQQLPHTFHAATVLLTFAAELVAPWVLFAPRRARLIVAAGLSLFQLSIIATANYAFLNYLVLVLGVFLVDDPALRAVGSRIVRCPGPRAAPRRHAGTPTGGVAVARWIGVTSAAVLVATVYISTVSFLAPAVPGPLLLPARALAPFRVANAYGLFAVMTTARYEIEFQGTPDDTTWIAYPFRYKPQNPWAAPGIYAPYQPRFDWNLWFASLGNSAENPWVVATQARLLSNDRSVLTLFAGNPFAGAPPRAVRTVLWRLWFTDLQTRRRTGRWWNRELLGLYAFPVRHL